MTADLRAGLVGAYRQRRAFGGVLSQRNIGAGDDKENGGKAG
jgi:hypothetical protein